MTMDTETKRAPPHAYRHEVLDNGRVDLLDGLFAEKWVYKDEIGLFMDLGAV